MERKMFDTPILPRLETILAEVKSGDLVVPEFQREFVWDDERRLNLMDSIAAGIPIGSLLVWRTAQRELATYSKIGGIGLDAPKSGSEKINYLIDGHQRVSTLFGALFTGRRETDEDQENGVRWPLYFELGAQERQAFRVRPQRGEVPDTWLPLNIIFDGDKLFEFTTRLREKKLRAQAKEAERLANIFRDYIIPLVPLVTEDLNVVTDAFVRINSQGKGMSEAHMLRALAYRKIKLDKKFADVRERLEAWGWGSVDSQILINVLKAQLGMNVYEADVRGIFDRLMTEPGPLDRLGDVFEDAVKLLGELGVRGRGALPYTYQVVSLAAVAAELKNPLSHMVYRDTLQSWFWTTTYTEFFSGTSGSRVRDGIRQLINALKTRRAFEWPDIGPVKPIRQIRTSTGRSRAFLLFLAQLPKDSNAASRRQEVLGSEDTPTAASLIAGRESGSPGNTVIATAAELRELRAAIKARSVSKEMADEHGIPKRAQDALRQSDLEGFIDERGTYLIKEELKFIQRWKLDVREGA